MVIAVIKDDSNRHESTLFRSLSEVVGKISIILLLRGISRGNMNFLRRAIAALLIATYIVAPAAGQERTATRCGFSLAPHSGKTILVFCPTVRVGAQSTGGMFEPNADWTDQALKNVDDALAKRQQALGNEVISAPSCYGEDAQLVEEYSALFAAISQSMIQYRFFVGNRLPTKNLDKHRG